MKKKFFTDFPGVLLISFVSTFSTILWFDIIQKLDIFNDSNFFYLNLLKKGKFFSNVIVAENFVDFCGNYGVKEMRVISTRMLCRISEKDCQNV